MTTVDMSGKIVASITTPGLLESPVLDYIHFGRIQDFWKGCSSVYCIKAWGSLF